MAIIRLSTIGTPADYQNGLFPTVCRSLGYEIEWATPKTSDILIIGPFAGVNKKTLRWCPKPLRPHLAGMLDTVRPILKPRLYEPIKIYQTGENTRHDHIPADYSISSDLGVVSQNHFRLPYWYELVNWSREGITGNQNPRFGELINLDRLLKPLGSHFLDRNNKVVLLTSHLREPRKSLLDALEKVVCVEKFGGNFNSEIRSHHDSGFKKIELLQNFSFNLCPENGLYPGYYTEKIPEAFQSGCLPISWTDTNVSIDFNPKAFINLLPFAGTNYEQIRELLNSKKALLDYAEQSLVHKKPSIEPFTTFVKTILQSTKS
jgi:Glycosyltransferase family 10 (fucosyltransferase) C-term